MAPKIKYGNTDCPACGKTFRKRRADHTHCSHHCDGQTRKAKRPKVICQQCGKIFSVEKMALVSGPRARKFCSPACRHLGHRVLPTPENIERAFWERVDKKGPDDCWNWTRVPGNTGYGILALYGFKKTAHRVSYELHYGPIPVLDGTHGGCVLHKCDNRLCVNPNHLWLGTQADNLKDMWNKGRAWRKKALSK